jgi:hypothetical protein
MIQGWAWLQPESVLGWHVVATADFNGDELPDLVWQNDTNRQVTVVYYGGSGGAMIQGWAWLQPNSVTGWSVVIR